MGKRQGFNGNRQLCSFVMNYLEHDLDEFLLVLFSELPQDEHAEVLEVDDPLLLHLVCHVDQLLKVEAF